jgi:hypothetical protein
MTFDPVGAAETSAYQTISLLLDPERAARLVEYHGRDSKQLGLGEVLDRLFAATWKSDVLTEPLAPVQRSVADVALHEVMGLAANDHAAAEVRAMALLKLTELRAWLTSPAASTADEQQRAHRLFAAAQIRKFEQEPAQVLKPTDQLAPPPGAPIGSLETEGDDLDY